MAKETTTSQSQQKAASSPIPPIPTMPGWDEGVARIEALVEQMAAWEKQAIAQVTEAAAHSAELAKTGLGYMTKLSETWRQMTLDAVRHGGNMSAQTFKQGN